MSCEGWHARAVRLIDFAPSIRFSRTAGGTELTRRRARWCRLRLGRLRRLRRCQRRNYRLQIKLVLLFKCSPHLVGHFVRYSPVETSHPRVPPTYHKKLPRRTSASCQYRHPGELGGSPHWSGAISGVPGCPLGRALGAWTGGLRVPGEVSGQRGP